MGSDRGATAITHARLFAIGCLVLAALPALAIDESLYEVSARGTVPGLSIPNSHALATDSVTGRPSVLRGRAPGKPAHYQELRRLGVTDVIIFKNDTKGEVAKEIENLQRIGYDARRIHHIPMPWKDLPDFRTACRMTLDALNRIHRIQSQGGRVYFHCTAGEDRTGMLAGLYRLSSGNADLRQVFQTEMCARGYEAGNPRKPITDVVLPIRRGLTPLFRIIAQRMALAKTLDPRICDAPATETFTVVDTAQFTCRH